MNKNSNETQKDNNNIEKYDNFNIDNQTNYQQEENENKFSEQKKINNNEKEDDDEILIELEIDRKKSDNEEINILCDIDKLIEDNKENEKYFKENKIEPPKIFDYFNENNTKLYLNNKEISFKYKLNIDKIGINNIIIKTKVKLLSLSSMFFFFVIK